MIRDLNYAMRMLIQAEWCVRLAIERLQDDDDPDRIMELRVLASSLLAEAHEIDKELTAMRKINSERYQERDLNG